MKKNLLFAAGVAMLCGVAHADLFNISTSGVHSASLTSAACGIVGRDGVTYRGTKILYVYAESTGNGKDPELKLRSLKYNLTVTNDDWQDPYYVNGVAKAPLPSSLLSTYLRLPNRLTDSAIIYFADPGEPVCAFSNEVTSSTNLFQVAISISDVTAAVYASGVRSTDAKSAEQALDKSIVDQLLQEHVATRQQR